MFEWKMLPQRNGKISVAAHAIAADQIIIEAPVVYCAAKMLAIKTPCILHCMSMTVSLSSLVKNS